MIFTFMQFPLGDAFNYPVFGKCRQPNKQANQQTAKQHTKNTHELQCCGEKCHRTIGLHNKLSE